LLNNPVATEQYHPRNCVPAEKALALVVRGTDWSETSRITTLFTREFGKIRGLAKGGRRLKSNFDIAFDLLNVCTVVFLRKAQGGLDLLIEAQVAERFPALRQDLPALYAGYYIAELLADGTQDYDPHPELFDTALATLRGLGEPGTRPLMRLVSPMDSVISFELVWLRELGYSPRLDACVSCDSEVIPPGAVRVFYSPLAGGVLCPACGPAATDRRMLTVAALQALRSLTDSLEGSGPRPEITAVRGELRSLLGQIVSFVLGRRPRLLSYLESENH
jgi:DNA repair protein RecO (recombination protein O)